MKLLHNKINEIHQNELKLHSFKNDLQNVMKVKTYYVLFKFLDTYFDYNCGYDYSIIDQSLKFEKLPTAWAYKYEDSKYILDYIDKIIRS